MKRRTILYLCLIVAIAVSLTTISCSSSTNSSDRLADISGVWKDKQCDCQIVIDLASDTKSISVDDKKLAVTIKEIVADDLLLSVTDGNGKTNDWKIIQVWDDNGSTFSLALIRDGKRETLSLVKKLT